MKINSSGLEHYQSYVKAVKSEDASAAKAKGKTTSSANTDKVTFSQDAAQRAETSRLVASLSAQVEGNASPQRVADLRQAVQSGSYHVAAGDVADAILNRIG